MGKAKRAHHEIREFQIKRVGTVLRAFAHPTLAQIYRAIKQGRPHIEVNAGELHRTLGDYPSQAGAHHNMPSCCKVMREEVERGRAQIVHETPSGNGAALTIRYQLPRG